MCYNKGNKRGEIMKRNTVKEVYESIKNPMECEDVLNFLESLYQRSAVPMVNANEFIPNVPRDIDIESALLDGYCNQKKSEMTGMPQLENYLWNLWRQNMLNSYKEDDDVNRLQNLLTKITFPCSDDEMKVLEQCPNFKKYVWKKEGMDTNTHFLCSRNLHALDGKTMSIQHQLMMNLESSDVAFVTYEFISYCEEMQLPYYIWIPKESSKIRTVEIGADSENLCTYLEILRKIQKEHPEIAKRCGRPPIFSGKIDEWIGYVSVVVGTSPHTLLRMQEKRLMEYFNDVTVECLNWLDENKMEKMLDDKQREVTVLEYLTQTQTLATKGDLGYTLRQHYTEVASCFPALRKIWREKLQKSFHDSHLWDEKICFRPEIKDIVMKDHIEEERCREFFERHSNEPWDSYYLIRMLPESLGKKQVLFPDGTTGELQRYIEEVMTDYIPSGGQLPLWNGEVVRVDQFVKDVVLFEGQYRYHGNIEKMISSSVNVDRFHDFPFQEKNVQEKESLVRHESENVILKRMYQLLLQMKPNQLKSYAGSQSGLESIKELQKMELTEEKDIQLRNEMIEILQSEQERKAKKM